MGRKIPAKKHKGVKDPLIQQAKRLNELKGKINAPPKDPDDQPVPKSLTQLFAFEHKKNDKGLNVKKKKKKYTKGSDNIESQNDNPVATLRKLPGETGRSFSMRINSAVRAIHTPVEQDDYPLDIETADRKGEQMALQRARRKRKQSKASSGAQPPPAAKPSRAHKLALKRKARRERALEGGGGGGGGGEVRRERVAFGEVAHAPPALLVRPRHATARGDRRPGRKELLLSAMLSGVKGGVKGGAKGEAKGARGALPAVEAEGRERARLEAVAAYRALRARPAPALRSHCPRTAPALPHS